jgi:hypothetical protein
MGVYSREGKNWTQTKEKMSQGKKKVRRKLARKDEQQEDKGGGTFSRVEKMRSCSAL